MATDLRADRWRTRFFARGYERFATAAESGWLGQVRAELVGSLTGAVLEIGAGAGHNLGHLPAVEQVTAVEPMPAMRRILAERARRLGLADRVHVLDATAEDLPVPDASQDAVVCTLVLCSVLDPDRVVDEALRVLRPGGRLVFVEHVRGAGFIGRLQRVARPLSIRYGGNCDPTRDTAASLRGAAQRHGATVDVRTLPGRRLGLVEQPVIAGSLRTCHPPASVR